MKNLRVKKSENENLRIKKSENGKSETNYNLVALYTLISAKDFPSIVYTNSQFQCSIFPHYVWIFGVIRTLLDKGIQN